MAYRRPLIMLALVLAAACRTAPLDIGGASTDAGGTPDLSSARSCAECTRSCGQLHDEKSCAGASATLGCTVFKCQGCRGLQFNSCLGPTQGIPSCPPPPPCPPPLCHKQSDCIGDEYCVPPREANPDMPIHCTRNDQCPVNFACSMTCQRKSCTSDSDCAGFCVNGACYSDIGTCVSTP
jgi:hypothetical protein